MISGVWRCWQPSPDPQRTVERTPPVGPRLPPSHTCFSTVSQYEAEGDKRRPASLAADK